MDILEGRQASEEAYLASLQELQDAILSQSATLQDDVRERIGQLRQVLNDREAHLLGKVSYIMSLSRTNLQWKPLHVTACVKNFCSSYRRAYVRILLAQALACRIHTFMAKIKQTERGKILCV